MKAHQIILNAIDDIPLVKDGKRGMAQLSSLHDDFKVLKSMKRAVEMRKDSLPRIKQGWDWYILRRNEEDFCPHTESTYQHEYDGLF